MRPEQIDKLDNNLQKEAHKVLLAPERFKLESFQLSLNYETISAADHCMAITALLARAEAASSSDAFWWVGRAAWLAGADSHVADAVGRCCRICVCCAAWLRHLFLLRHSCTGASGVYSIHW